MYAKVEYNENPIGESQKTTFFQEAITELNFQCQLSVNVSDSVCLDDLAHKPVIVTLVEVLPKEKKQKEEKVQNFGQATFSLFDVLKGKTEFSLKLNVYATPGSTLEGQSSETAPPELEIRVSLDQPLLSDEERNKTNLLTISLESMYAIPDLWNNPTKDLACTVSIPIPTSDEVKQFFFCFSFKKVENLSKLKQNKNTLTKCS